MKLGQKITLALINIRKDLLLILLGCVLFVFLYTFWFINVPEIFNGASKLGDIFYKLSFAYIGASIFYFLNVFIKAQKDLNEVNYFIGRFVSNIINDNSSIVVDLKKVSQLKTKGIFPTEDEMKEITRNVLINSCPKSGNWFSFFAYCKKRTIQNITRILSRSNFIESKLVGILSEIEDSEFYIDIDYQALWVRFNNNNLSFISTHLFHYFQIIERLDIYYWDRLYPYITSQWEERRNPSTE